MICWDTVGIGFVVLMIGGGGFLKVRNQYLAVAGGAGAVIIFVGILGVGCGGVP